MLQPDTVQIRELPAAPVTHNDQLRQEAAAQAQLATQMGALPPPAVALFGQEEALGRWNARKHMERFPINDHLFSLMTIVQTDLTENTETS